MELAQVGKFKIVGKLGHGAMGEVFRALDPVLGREVAIKVVTGKLSEDEGARVRFLREAQAAATLNHPNIVTVYDFGEEQGQAFMAMELLEGQDLRELLAKGTLTDLQGNVAIMEQILDGLAFAHANGVVHRDIKPANIMVMNNFQVKVMDFGIARLETSASMTQTGIAMGTPNYISPEQLQGKPVDRRSDIFALGVVLYEFLSHEKPFRGENLSQLIYNIINFNPPTPVERDENIPMILNRVTMRAIAKDPQERYQRAGELAVELKEFLASFIPTAPKPRQPAGQQTQV